MLNKLNKYIIVFSILLLITGRNVFTGSSKSINDENTYSKKLLIPLYTRDENIWNEILTVKYPLTVILNPNNGP